MVALSRRSNPSRSPRLWVIALMALVGACRSGTPGARHAGQGQASQASVPAFIVYGNGETFVIPVDPSLPTRRGSGYFSPDPEDASRIHHVVSGRDATDDWGMVSCPCQEGAGTCAVVSRELVVGEAISQSVSGGCRCALTEESLPTLYPAYPERAYRELGAPCTPEYEEAALPNEYVGAGRAVALDMGSSLVDECGHETGTNIYDLWIESVALYPNPPALRAPSEYQVCEEGMFIPGGPMLGDEGVLTNSRCPMNATPDEAETESEGMAAEDELEGEMGYDYEPDCRELCELKAPARFITQGHVCWSNASMSPVGGEAAAYRCDPLTPERCADPFDPCGDPAPFLASGVVAEPYGAVDYWVSRSGEYLLTSEGAIFQRERTEARRQVDFGEFSAENARPDDRFPGIVFVPDARALLVVLEAHPVIPSAPELMPTEADPDAAEPALCDEETPCPAGQHCDENAFECVEDCSSDDDCAILALCGAHCVYGRCVGGSGECQDDGCERGLHCLPGGGCGFCRDNLDCAYGDVCAEGDCMMCSSDDECPRGSCDGERCVEADCPSGATASTLGNRAFRALRAGDTTEARHLAACALSLSPEPNVLGAIRYTLGRAAEAEERPQAAIDEYGLSLDARPGVSEVIERRRALLAPDPLKPHRATRS